MTTEPLKRLYKLADAARELNVSYNTLKARIRAGAIMVVPRVGAEPGDLRGAQVPGEEIAREIASRTTRYARPA